MIKLERPSHKYPCCDPVDKHSIFPATTTRNIPWVEFVFPTWDLAGYSKFGAQLWGTIGSKLLNHRNVEGGNWLKEPGANRNNNQPYRLATYSDDSRCRRYHSRTEGASRKQRPSFAAKQTSSAVPSPPNTRRHSPTTTTVATFTSHNCAPQVSERRIVERTCVCEVTSGRKGTSVTEALHL